MSGPGRTPVAETSAVDLSGTPLASTPPATRISPEGNAVAVWSARASVIVNIRAADAVLAALEEPLLPPQPTVASAPVIARIARNLVADFIDTSLCQPLGMVGLKTNGGPFH